MLEILQFIFSSFWVWLGVTILVYLVLKAVCDLVKSVYSILAHDNTLRQEAMTQIIKNILSNQDTTSFQKITQVYAIIIYSHELKHCNKQKVIEMARKIEESKM